MDEALDAFDLVGLPAIIRPSFTLGGEGVVAYNKSDLKTYVKMG